jgi:peptide/nickel transport system ATP-binding protein
LFVSHNLGIVDRLCRRICVLYGGEVVESGATSAILAAPSHPYTKGLVASLPRIAVQRRSRLPSIPGSFERSAAGPEGCAFAPRCPFVETSCRALPQSLLPTGRGGLARCWKSDRLAATPWPSPPASAREPQPVREVPLIEVNDLSKVYSQGGFLASIRLERTADGRRRLVRRPAATVAVGGVSFTIGRGEVVGLVGESGSGKSTIGRGILGLIEPSGGEVIFDGEDFLTKAGRNDRSLRKRAQLIFQNSAASLNPRKTIGAAIERPLVLHQDMAPEARRARVAELLTHVGLAPAYAERYPHQLSGGERQRVNIARALATAPEFVVCDEAVSALDVSVQANILNLLADLRDEMGLSYLFITHDISVVAHIADRLIVLYGGRICEEGPVGQVLHPPFHPYTEALLSSVPQLVGAEWEGRPDSVLLDEPGPPPAPGGCPLRGRCPRKLGRICDEREPPMVEVGGGHRIACHIPIAQLAAPSPAGRSESPPRQNRGTARS